MDFDESGSREVGHEERLGSGVGVAVAVAVASVFFDRQLKLSPADI